MYQWRKLNNNEREALLAHRREQKHPHHSPPHYASEQNLYHVSAACYEHRPWIGVTPKRMIDFTYALSVTLAEIGGECHAWCVLPNHYHTLIKTTNLKGLVQGLGHLHGRSAFLWNGEEGCRGRKVWSPPSDRAIRSERHYWATMNYVHHNPVHHGYVEKWRDWPYTSAHEYVAYVGEEETARIWKEYPILEYGKGWDDEDM